MVFPRPPARPLVTAEAVRALLDAFAAADLGWRAGREGLDLAALRAWTDALDEAGRALDVIAAGRGNLAWDYAWLGFEMAVLAAGFTVPDTTTQLLAVGGAGLLAGRSTRSLARRVAEMRRDRGLREEIAAAQAVIAGLRI